MALTPPGSPPRAAAPPAAPPLTTSAAPAGPILTDATPADPTLADPVTTDRTPADPCTEAERREARLAELVAGLTGRTSTGAARQAVRDNQGEGDALQIVARAMRELDGPDPEGFRVAGFLREDALVVHGSLRRWDRLHREEDRVEDQIVDARFATRRTIDLG